MKYTIKDFQNQFPNNDACLAYVFKQKYSDIICEKCGKKDKYARIKNRKAYACSCGYQIRPLKDTPMHKSSTDLTLWFYAIYMFSQRKKGMPATELQRFIGVTYKCAWRMCKLIRELMREDHYLFGVVEMDEAYIGGRHKKSWNKKKTPVLGAIERNGRVTAKVVSNTSSYKLKEFIQENISVHSILITDEYRGYNKKVVEGYNHRKVNHSIWYVDGYKYTNTIEGFWSHLKRFIRGTHHWVSPHHLQSYLDLMTFQYNYRNQDRFHLLLDRL